jgi:P-type conjugative transfer protein TrbJ
MSRLKKKLIIAAAAASLFAPAAGFADIVFDPANFVEAVAQVTEAVQLVEQFKQQVTNQLAMLKSLGFSQLGGILQSMDVWQQVFGQAGGAYSTTDPGTALDRQYPPDPGAYAGVSDSSIEAMQNRWDQEARQILIENRTVQNQTVLSLGPTAERINQYVEHSNSASGVTAVMQAGNEELATLVAQLQALQSQEVTDARGEVERDAKAQAEEAYAEQQRQAVRAGWANPAPPTLGLADAFALGRP